MAAADPGRAQPVQLFDTDTRGPAVIPPSYDTGRCKGCGARIMWATNCDRAGDPKRHPDGKAKKVPLNIGYDTAGTWRLIGRGRACTIAKGEPVLPQDRYMGHHATCTAAKRFRRSR